MGIATKTSNRYLKDKLRTSNKDYMGAISRSSNNQAPDQTTEIQANHKRARR